MLLPSLADVGAFFSRHEAVTLLVVSAAVVTIPKMGPEPPIGTFRHSLWATRKWFQDGLTVFWNMRHPPPPPPPPDTEKLKVETPDKVITAESTSASH